MTVGWCRCAIGCDPRALTIESGDPRYSDCRGGRRSQCHESYRRPQQFSWGLVWSKAIRKVLNRLGSPRVKYIRHENRLQRRLLYGYSGGVRSHSRLLVGQFTFVVARLN